MKNRARWESICKRSKEWHEILTKSMEEWGSNIGFIRVHGFNEGHIAPYTHGYINTSWCLFCIFNCFVASWLILTASLCLWHSLFTNSEHSHACGNYHACANKNGNAGVQEITSPTKTLDLTMMTCYFCRILPGRVITCHLAVKCFKHHKSSIYLNIYVLLKKLWNPFFFPLSPRFSRSGVR